MTPQHFISKSTIGEVCGMCFRENKPTPATHKVGEELPHDYPTHRHNLTQYVCCHHFRMIVGAWGAERMAGCKE